MDLLFLAHRAPFPPDRGDKIRSYHVLRHLAARARVHLLAFGETDADLAVPPVLAEQLASVALVRRSKPQVLAAVEALASGRPVSLTAFRSREMATAVRRVLSEQRVEAVYCFSGQMAQYLPAGKIPTVMDFVDVDSAKFAGFADAGRWPMRWMMRREARRLGAFERDIARTVDASLFVSDAEAALFRSRGGRGRIMTVENGIDAAAFDPAEVAPIAAGAPLVVFTGQMDYRPNVAAVAWFAGAVVPRLRARHPGLRFAIVGRAPSAAVRDLAGDGVIVTGAVDDVRPWLAAADVCVAPLKLARGIQNKVLEAMTMARPVVASGAAAEGIDHHGTLRVADSPDAYVETILTLLGDPARARAMGAAARARVMTRYDWAARLAPLDGLLGLEGGCVAGSGPATKTSSCRPLGPAASRA